MRRLAIENTSLWRRTTESVRHAEFHATDPWDNLHPIELVRRNLRLLHSIRDAAHRLQSPTRFLIWNLLLYVLSIGDRRASTTKPAHNTLAKAPAPLPPTKTAITKLLEELTKETGEAIARNDTALLLAAHLRWQDFRTSLLAAQALYSAPGGIARTLLSALDMWDRPIGSDLVHRLLTLTLPKRDLGMVELDLWEQYEQDAETRPYSMALLRYYRRVAQNIRWYGRGRFIR